jgi:hypothetical protein
MARGSGSSHIRCASGLNACWKCFYEGSEGVDFNLHSENLASPASAPIATRSRDDNRSGRQTARSSELDMSFLSRMLAHRRSWTPGHDAIARIHMAGTHVDRRFSMVYEEG